MRLKIQMRAGRKPLTSRFEPSIDSLPQKSAEKVDELKDLFGTLLEFVRKFGSLDPKIYGVVSELDDLSNELICAVQVRNPKLYTHSIKEAGEKWKKLETKINEIITLANSADLVTLSEKELTKLDEIINKVNCSPPSTPNLIKAHAKAFKAILKMTTAAKELLTRQEIEPLRVQLVQLKNDLGHQYESFFRLSQIDKTWKKMVGDECRRAIDHIILFTDFWNDVGNIKCPPVVEQITNFIDDAATSSPRERRRAPSASSVRKTTGQMKPIAIEERKLLYGNAEQTPKKGKIPVSVRSKSASSARSGRVRKEPLSPQLLDLEPEPTTPPKTTPKTRQSRITPPSARRRPGHDDSETKKIVPLHESPKIETRKKREDPLAQTQTVTRSPGLDLGSSSDDELLSTSKVQSPSLTKLANDLAELELDGDNTQERFMTELRDFEAKFARYVAAVGANDSLNRFLNELRVTNKARQNKGDIEHHMTRLGSLMKQIEEKVVIAKPLFEIEQRLQEVTFAITACRKQMATATHEDVGKISGELAMLKRRLNLIQESCEREGWTSQLEDLKTEIQRLDEAAAVFVRIEEMDAEIRRLRRENIDLIKACEKTKREQNADLATQRRKVQVEMKAVQCRIESLQNEKKKGEFAEGELEDIEAELEALLEQQMDLIDKMSALK